MMDPSSSLYSILIQWAIQAPVLLAYSVGIVLALTSWQTYRIPSVLTLCGIVLLGAVTLGAPVTTTNLYRLQNEMHWTIKQVGFVSLALGVLWSLCRAAGVALLIAAVFHRRTALLPSRLPSLPIP